MLRPEIEQLKTSRFAELKQIASKPDLPARYEALLEFHKQTTSEYLKHVNRLTNSQAEETSSDGRKVKIVIAHIMAWEEWQLQVFEEPNSERRQEKLIAQTNLQNYFDAEKNITMNFENVDEFNKYQEEKYIYTDWETIREKANSVALRLQNCFSPERRKEWISFFENTDNRAWRDINTKSGWYLWMVSLRHEAIEHIEDLTV